VGHVKDKWGHSIYGWREASRFANYSRRHFGVQEVPYEYHQTEPHQELGTTNNPDNPDDDAAGDTSTMGNTIGTLADQPVGTHPLRCVDNQI